LLEARIDAHGMTVKRPSRAGMPAIVWTVRKP
jgi:hypothetical protein